MALATFQLSLDIALSHLSRRKRQTVVSILGVTLGVGFFIAIAAIMAGFQTYFIEQVINVAPHIIIKDEFRNPPQQPARIAYPEAAIEIKGLRPQDEPRGIRTAQAILSILSEIPGLIASATLQGQVFLRYGSADVSSTLIGIVPEQERQGSTLEQDLVSGTLDSLYSSANPIILGEGLAQRLGVREGDRAVVASPAGVVMNMKIVSIFRTGITSLDDAVSYTLLKKAQQIQNRTETVNQIRIWMKDIEKADVVARQLEARFDYKAEPWQETNRNILGIFVIQNAIMYSTTGAILLVAAFGIFNIISTVVLEKIRDIAILKSIGLEERDIRRIFLIEGLMVGVVGMILGWVAGYGLVEIIASLRFETEGFVRGQGFFIYYSFIPYAVAGAAALLSAGFAAYLPARKAAHVNPVDIIRGAA